MALKEKKEDLEMVTKKEFDKAIKFAKKHYVPIIFSYLGDYYEIEYFDGNVLNCCKFSPENEAVIIDKVNNYDELDKIIIDGKSFLEIVPSLDYISVG